MKISKIILLLNTIKYLKVKQLLFQVFYRINKVKPLAKYRLNQDLKVNFLAFSNFLKTAPCAEQPGSFNFLNLRKEFGNGIDWDFMEYGKLWNYNLHYFNYLGQNDISVDEKIAWLKNLYEKLDCNPNGLEPYPVSLRLINTIRFLSEHQIEDQAIIQAVAAEANFLSRRIEYHILGNHVLENAFALLMAGAFFGNMPWTYKAHSLLHDQLKEQLLKDGGHFELSPMYHQIILFRVLELIDWYSNWTNKKADILENYIARAKQMLGWIQQMSFSNGDIPLLNDSADKIAYTSQELFSYATFLKIDFSKRIQLSESGYRAYKNQNYECIVDVGHVGVSYQPGHAHADALSFILYACKQPVFVEMGTSTYQIGERRSLERSTAAHNTLVYKKQNQSQVWSGFRVGKRAKVIIENESETSIEAYHDGYQHKGGIHRRAFKFNETSITIIDEFVTKQNMNAGDCIVYFHFHPDVTIVLDNGKVLINNMIKMNFKNSINLDIESYKFSSQFNSYRDATLLKVEMNSMLQTDICFS